MHDTQASNFLELFSNEGLSAHAYLLLTLQQIPVNKETTDALNNPEIISFSSFEAMMADLDCDEL